MARLLTDDGIYFVVFNGDIQIASGESEVAFFKIDIEGLNGGDEIPEEYVRPELPHTVLRFKAKESIDVLIQSLLLLKENFKPEGEK